MSDKPAIQTSSTANPIDITATNNAKYVYVKVDEPKGLNGRFEGPYKIVSRPSRSQVELKIGTFANGAPRLQVYHWSSCKIAHVRDGAEEGSRPQLGRKPQARPDPEPPSSLLKPETPSVKMAVEKEDAQNKQPVEQKGAEIQMRNRPIRSTRNKNPNYVE